MTKSFELAKYIKAFSPDDLLRSFFVINLWLPNISIPIKSQYWYIVFESIFDQLSHENQINTYEDFRLFCNEIIKHTPAFSMLEDYIPETDWGNIKYFYKDKMYKIFYGGDLSNPYDFIYSFEILHRSFEEYYLKNINRSPLKELEYFLFLQDYILSNLTQEPFSNSSLNPGDISIPTKEFWENCNNFLSTFTPEIYYPEILPLYLLDLDISPVKALVEIDEFQELAFKGLNCQYFFIKIREKHYPVLPRKFLSVLYDKWGRTFQKKYLDIKKEKKDIEIAIGVELFKFLKDRVNEKEIFGLVSPFNSDQKPYANITFAAAVRSKHKLYLINMAPIPTENLKGYFNNLNYKLKKARELLMMSPTRLMLWVQGQAVEFRHDDVLSPVFLTVIPNHIACENFSIPIPKDFSGRVIALDQIAGIFDEIKEENELDDFFEFLHLNENIDMPPITSFLDKFGAFRDSHSVLVSGAMSPDWMVIDFHWGSNIRYRSLSEFWEHFPGTNFFGHPRSWAIPEKSGHKDGTVLKSKIFFGYAYCQKVGNAVFFINAPVHKMNFEKLKISDLLMQVIFDALYLYEEPLKTLFFFKDQKRIHILIVPDSLVKDETDFAHLRHLVPICGLWSMDITQLKNRDLEIRVVFDEKESIHSFQNIQDRSVQINLLLDLLRQLNGRFEDIEFPIIEGELSQEKIKRRRFKIFSINREMSFPERIEVILPEEKNLKVADKIVAQIARDVSIEPGTYVLEDAKLKLNALIKKLVDYLNMEIFTFRVEESIIILLEKIDALTNEYSIGKRRIMETVDLEVDFDREDKTSKEYIEFFHQHKNYKYLLEKFVQIQPNGKRKLAIADLRNLLAIIDRILNIYWVSDTLQYDIYSPCLTINSDFRVSIEYTIDIQSMQYEYRRKQSQIELGIIGDKKDYPDPPISINDYLEQLDLAFKQDLGFGFKNLINIQQVMSLWPVYNGNVEESTYYFSDTEEISKICSENIIEDFDSSETEGVLNFLTLDPREILTIEGEAQIPNDLPIWEYNKRSMRYSIRPLIKIGEKYYWGPHSICRSGKLWSNIAQTNRLPADINAPTIWNILNQGHRNLETSLQKKIVDIAKRHSIEIEENIYPHRLIGGMQDIGDCDLLVFLRSQNTLLNIESKIINPAYCLKDIKRIREKIFGRTKADNSFQKGYLQKVECRENYLKQHINDVFKNLKWNMPEEPPKIISVFVTQVSFWWTQFPPVDTSVVFKEIKMLNDFLNVLLR